MVNAYQSWGTGGRAWGTRLKSPGFLLSIGESRSIFVQQLQLYTSYLENASKSHFPQTKTVNTGGVITVSDFTIQCLSRDNDELLEQKSEEKWLEYFLQKSRCKVLRAISASLTSGCLAGRSWGMAPSWSELSRRPRRPPRCRWSRTLRWGFKTKYFGLPQFDCDCSY